MVSGCHGVHVKERPKAMNDTDPTERLCPNCFQNEWEYVARNPAADTVVCRACDWRGTAAELHREGENDPEAGFHNDPRAWSK